MFHICIYEFCAKRESDSRSRGAATNDERCLEPLANAEVVSRMTSTYASNIYLSNY